MGTERMSAESVIIGKAGAIAVGTVLFNVPAFFRPTLGYSRRRWD